MKIEVASSVQQALALRSAGWCPVECAFGTESVVDELVLDHHGPFSNLEPVSIRGYRDHQGCRRADPRFVVAGSPDADATFAIASLADVLPADTECRSADPGRLAQYIAARDLDPLEKHNTGAAETDYVRLFGSLKLPLATAEAWVHGVMLWPWLLRAAAAPALAAACRSWDDERLRLGRAAPVEQFGPHVALVESSVWAFDVWYDEISPVILHFEPSAGRVTIGCRDAERAAELFGNGGLKRVYPQLRPDGWGGRESVGGSPRHVCMSRQDAVRAAERVSELAVGNQ